MKTLRLAAATALVSSVFALSASAAESEWWNVDFENPTPGGTNLVVGALGPLTNDAATMAAGTVQPYASGVWSAVDGDESYVTNEFNPSGSFGGSNCLRLDTQGNDLTWTPKVPTNGVQTLVDAELYLVGSDSAPTDFDANHDVQAAIYLKNLTDEDNGGDTTNSVLCVYVSTNTASSGGGWVELAGYNTTPTNDLLDNAWYRIQVVVDHTVGIPQVSVKVNGTQMYAVGDPSKTTWPAANNGTAQAAAGISSVAFRGTGAVDNFVGKTIVVEEEFYTFTAQVFIDNDVVNPGSSGNTTRERSGQPVGIGATVTFAGFTIDDSEDNPTYGLSRIEILDPVSGTVVTNFDYTYDAGEATCIDDASNYVSFEDPFLPREFSVIAPSEGAVSNAVLAKIYFTSFNPPQVVVEPVDPGDSMSAVEKAQYVPAGVVTETDDQTGVTTTSFVVHFKGVAGVTYELLSSTTLTLTEAEWKAATVEDTVVCTSANEDDVLELKVELDPNDTAKFFKIGASATQP